MPEGITHCGACLREPPPLDACLAAVTYGWPWSDCVTQFKFGNLPGWFGDRHPNQAGYRVIADETAKFLAPIMRARLRNQ